MGLKPESTDDASGDFHPMNPFGDVTVETPEVRAQETQADEHPDMEEDGVLGVTVIQEIRSEEQSQGDNVESSCEGSKVDWFVSSLRRGIFGEGRDTTWVEECRRLENRSKARWGALDMLSLSYWSCSRERDNGDAGPLWDKLAPSITTKSLTISPVSEIEECESVAEPHDVGFLAPEKNTSVEGNEVQTMAEADDGFVSKDAQYQTEVDGFISPDWKTSAEPEEKSNELRWTAGPDDWEQALFEDDFQQRSREPEQPSRSGDDDDNDDDALFRQHSSEQDTSSGEATSPEFDTDSTSADTSLPRHRKQQHASPKLGTSVGNFLWSVSPEISHADEDEDSDADSSKSVFPSFELARWESGLFTPCYERWPKDPMEVDTNQTDEEVTLAAHESYWRSKKREKRRRVEEVGPSTFKRFDLNLLMGPCLSTPFKKKVRRDELMTPSRVMKFKLGDSCKLVLQRGDITRWSIDGVSDAIVNAANERMLGGAGVDGAIHRAAGPELLEACKALPLVDEGIRCHTGEAVETPGFQLKVARIIHTVGPMYDRAIKKECEELLTSSYKKSLILAKERGIKHIAFPAISCGIYGYPLDSGSRTALKAVKENYQGLLQVHFILFDEETWNAWKRAAEDTLEKDED